MAVIDVHSNLNSWARSSSGAKSGHGGKVRAVQIVDRDETDTRISGPELINPRILLRFESAAVFLLSPLLYGWLGESWWLALILFFAPDLSFITLAAGPRTGATVYNLAHSYLLPASLAAIAIVLDSDLTLAIALIWSAHIALDRTIGYGLRYTFTGPKETHLDRV